MFEIDLRGRFYPVDGNPPPDLQPFSQPYKVKLKTLVYAMHKVKLGNKDKLEQLTLVPITLVFDVIELPAKILGIYYQP